jgi:putative phosphoesterase
MEKYIELGRKYIKGADVLIHLGDNSEDIEELTKDFKGEVYGVRGNCDYSNTYPTEQLLDIMGKKIFLTHGHLYGVKNNLINIYYRAKELNADIVLFGHTHENIVKEKGGIVFMNPGSISLPRLRGRYIGFIELKEEKRPNSYLKEIESF